MNKNRFNGGKIALKLRDHSECEPVVTESKKPSIHIKFEDRYIKDPSGKTIKLKDFLFSESEVNKNEI